MKEVRYNDKLWFGKHKGVRLCDVIRHDPCFIQKMIKENKFVLDKKSNKLLNGENIDNQPVEPFDEIRPFRIDPNPFHNPIPEQIAVEEEQANPRRVGVIFKSKFMINRDILNLPEDPRNNIIKNIFRDGFNSLYNHIPDMQQFGNLCNDILVYFSEYFIRYINVTELVGTCSIVLKINDNIIHKVLGGATFLPDDICLEISDEQDHRHVKSYID